MFIRIAKATVRDGHWGEYEWAFRKDTLDWRLIPGVISFIFARSESEENVAITVLTWSSKGFADAYYQSEHYSQLHRRHESHLSGEIVLMEGDIRFAFGMDGRRLFTASRWLRP